MEQCLRIALWMVVLTGCLQAKSLTPGPDATKTCWSFNSGLLENLGFLRRVEEVNCHQNTFPSLDITADCVEVWACCIEGLKDAMSNCTNDNERIDNALYDLKKGSENVDLPECKRPKTSTFKGFVDKIESFAQFVNTITT